ncbi:MAG: hypothetical protein ABIJ85_00025 [bacterium]
MEFDGRKISKLNELEIIELQFETVSDEEARVIAMEKWTDEDKERQGSKTVRMKRNSALYKQISYP